MLIASAAGVSAHIVRGIRNPTLATAFVSSPVAGADLPIKVMWGTQDTGLRIVCFYVANTSPARADAPDWPRITAVGFELPGSPSGFSLLEPLNGEWDLIEGRTAAIPNDGTVTLDVAIVARVNPAGWFRNGPHDPLGLPPGQRAARGSGMRFCVSGPFPDTLPNPADPATPIVTTIEQIISGVVVRFHRVEPDGPGTDVGVWEGRPSTPLYPD
jgi:hypothetical protein